MSRDGTRPLAGQMGNPDDPYGINTGTRKVAINACFGGFNVSWAAAQRIAARKGLVASYVDLSPDIHLKVYGRHGLPDEMGVANIIGPTAVTSYPEKLDNGFFDPNDLPRDDADLVAVIEELGDAANTDVSKLKVVEIPANVTWHIEQYDGREHIAEDHRTWP